MGTLIGRRDDGRPLHLIAGGAEDDAPPPAEEWTPPTRAEVDAMRAENAASKAEAVTAAEQLRAFLAAGADDAPKDDDDTDDDDTAGKAIDPEIVKLQRALKQTRAEAKTRREREEKLLADIDAKDKAGKAELAEARRESEIAEKARAEAEARYKPATIRAAATPALLAAGAIPARADKLVRLLDHSALDLDPSGEVTGLAEQVAAVKADYPELFTGAEPERRIPRVTGGDRPPADQAPKSTAERIASQVLGRTA